MFDIIFKKIFKKSPTAKQKKLIVAILGVLAVALAGSNFTVLDKLFGINNYLTNQIKINNKADNINKSVANNEDEFIGNYLVTRIIDGDTIEINGGEKVRYIGLDAPEKGGCFSEEATLKNQELVAGKEVRLEKDKTGRDKYGRLLRYVYVDDVFVNEKLVRDGFAYAQAYSPDIGRQAILNDASQFAWQNNLGIWQACARILE